MQEAVLSLYQVYGEFLADFYQILHMSIGLLAGVGAHVTNDTGNTSAYRTDKKFPQYETV